MCPRSAPIVEVRRSPLEGWEMDRDGAGRPAGAGAIRRRGRDLPQLWGEDTASSACEINTNWPPNGNYPAQFPPGFSSTRSVPGPAHRRDSQRGDRNASGPGDSPTAKKGRLALSSSFLPLHHVKLMHPTTQYSGNRALDVGPTALPDRTRRFRRAPPCSTEFRPDYTRYVPLE